LWRCDHASPRRGAAVQAQAPPFSPQRQSLPHAHVAAPGCVVAAATVWQPHVQPAHGHTAHWQEVVSVEFMVFLSARCRTRRVREEGFSGGDAPRS